MGDFKLSENHSWFDLTQTMNKKLQDQNRKEAGLFIDSIKAVAILLEIIRPVTGPLEIHSCFRGPSVNALTPGSSKKSQHLTGEAVDFSCPGIDNEASIDKLFNDCLVALISTGTSFGQLIKESATGRFRKSLWVHLSLGVPFREAEKCGQVATIDNGIFNLVKVIPIGR